MSIAVATPASGTTLAQDPIRVMVVDDAIVVRGLMRAGSRPSPISRSSPRCAADVKPSSRSSAPIPTSSFLDVDMPDVDGITALPRLLEKKRDLVVLMASTLTRRNAEISLRALALGAADYIPKQTNREFATSPEFRRELIDKVRALGARRLGPAAAACMRRPCRSVRASARGETGPASRRPASRRARPVRQDPAAAVAGDAAARAADRLVDRRTAALNLVVASSTRSSTRRRC